MKRRILVVDDEPNIRLSFRYGLLSEEWEVEEAASGTEAVAKAGQSPFDLMLLDLRMPGLDGIQVLQRLQEQQLRLPAVMVSAHATTDTVIQAIQRGTLDFLTKPVTPEQLRSAIREVLERFDFARAHERSTVDRRPLTDEEKLKLAKYYVFERRYEEAEKLFLQLAEGPHQEEALLMLGILSEIGGNFKGAEAHYTKVLNPSLEGWKEKTKSRSLFEHLSGG